MNRGQELRFRSATQSGFAAALATVAGEQKYGVLHVPILAIYALPHDMGKTNPRRIAEQARDIESLTAPQAKAFEEAIPAARIVRLPGASH